jgi:hypothetical protein
MRRCRRITLSSLDGVVLEGRCRGRRPRKDVCLVSPLPNMYMVPDESIAPIYLYLDRTSIAGPTYYYAVDEPGVQFNFEGRCGISRDAVLLFRADGWIVVSAG